MVIGIVSRTIPLNSVKLAKAVVIVYQLVEVHWGRRNHWGTTSNDGSRCLALVPYLKAKPKEKLRERTCERMVIGS